ncbi:MAG: tripartite tricarboxylate transporter permease [Thermoplasmata archaeon]|nr:tripartite tricarboxylate transporter permease [Thermoplasmata archaeon]
MDSTMGLLAAALVFTIAGTGMGTFTGLVPGVHVNTVAVFVLALQAPLFAAVSSVSGVFGVEADSAPILVALMVTAMAVAHTFLDIIPSVFLGAPDPDTALTVLPGHRMMLSGRGYEAIRYSALGSLGAALVALVLILPARILMGEPINAYEHITPFIPWVLIAVSSFMILGERATWEKIPQRRRKSLEAKGRNTPTTGDHLRQKTWALGIFLLSGLLGWTVLNGGLETHNTLLFPSVRASLLFPLFTGLFGIAGMLLSLYETPQTAEQKMDNGPLSMETGAKMKNVTAGTIAGSMVGWLPGISSASATVVAQTLVGKQKPEDADRGFIVAVSGVNTANVLMNVVALFVIMKARSGAMQAVSTIAGDAVRGWDVLLDVPPLFSLLLVAVILTSIIGYVLTIRIGRVVAGRYDAIPYRETTLGIVIFLWVMVALLSGPVGILVACVSTLVGLLPPLVGVQRVHMMGCIVVPVIMFFI